MLVKLMSWCVYHKSVFKGGGGSNPPKIFRFFLKSEGKEVEKKRGRKKKKQNEKGWGGGGVIVNIFLGSEIFLSGVQIFFGGGGWVEKFRGVEKFSGG